MVLKYLLDLNILNKYYIIEKHRKISIYYHVVYAKNRIKYRGLPIYKYI